MTIAVLAALAAGACFALAGVLQQRAASARPDTETLSWRLLRQLARQPAWLAGIGLAVLAYGFQSLGLAFGPLSLVQPLIVTELVFAIPLSARLARTRLGAREWGGVLAVAGGLALALSTARPHGGARPDVGLGPWLWTLGAVGGVVLAALSVRRSTAGAWQASATALAAGVVMGFQSVLLSVTVSRFDQGVAAVATAWQTYLLVAVSVGGLLLIQSAFQEGPLAASMTVLDMTEPAVAIAAGTVLFGESLYLGPVATPLTVLGVVLALSGIVSLDSSPVVAALHRQERRGRNEAADDEGDDDPDGETDGETDRDAGTSTAEAAPDGRA
ncbi:DMT family transporter [Streptomyces sp. bgisy153]|uniref:DMT family transporter n=1 Tax=Streptomyces sp. bgisy153 TaxID=3413793 RepID=UPI003D70A58C